MSSTLFHLAEFNVAKATAPIDSPAMAEFVAQIAEVNAAAEAAPGFVWRLKSDADVVYPESLSDATLLVNISVWVSVETLYQYQYIYSGRHLEVFRDRAKWFGERQAPGLASWWIPAGHIPNLEEAQARLEHLQQHGPTAAAFSLKKPFPPPAIVCRRMHRRSMAVAHSCCKITLRTADRTPLRSFAIDKPDRLCGPPIQGARSRPAPSSEAPIPRVYLKASTIK
jgi:hypothetical protein